jgi:acyl-CoA thioesterase-2
VSTEADRPAPADQPQGGPGAAVGGARALRPYPDARTFLGIEPTDDPRRWLLPLRKEIMTARDFLYGGAGLAAGIAALEATTGRPLVWATAQYFSFARMPGTLDITLDIVVTGTSTTQARCSIAQGGDEILDMLATLGRRPAPATGTWVERPAVRPIAETRPQVVAQAVGSVHEALDMRLVHGVSRRQLLRGRPVTNTGGRAAFWLRIPGGARVPDAADLALVGDTVPAAFASATGQPISGNSLDNTIRVGTLVWTEWVLVDVQVHALVDGYGHGIAHLWAEDGTLLGTASQSAVVRTPPP